MYDMLETWLREAPVDSLCDDIVTYSHGDNKLYAIVLGLYEKMDSTYKKQFKEAIDE